MLIVANQWKKFGYFAASGAAFNEKNTEESWAPGNGPPDK